MHTGELKIAAALSDARTLAEELKDFQRNVSEAGGATHNARTGAHEDQRAADRAIAKMTGFGLRDAVSIAAGLHSRTSYSNAALSGSFSSNHVSARPDLQRPSGGRDHRPACSF